MYFFHIVCFEGYPRKLHFSELLLYGFFFPLMVEKSIEVHLLRLFSFGHIYYTIFYSQGIGCQVAYQVLHLV